MYTSLHQQIKTIVTQSSNDETKAEFQADVEGWCRVHGLVMGNGSVRSRQWK